MLELIFGYNGLGRITGEQVGSVGGSPGGGWGETGLTRLFDSVSGGMISWLIPAALILAVVAMIAIGRRSRTDPARAAIMIFTGWLLVTGLVFSFMAGIYHDYYTVALAPAIAGTITVSAAELWRQPERWLSRIGLAVAIGATTAWAVVLLARASEPYSSLRLPIAVIGGLAMIGLLVAGRLPRLAARAVVVAAGLAALAGPTAYSLHTVANAHQGSIVTAGPVEPGPGSGGMIIYGTPPGGQGPGGPREFRTGGAGGLLGGGEVSQALAAKLKDGSAGYTWAAATTGSQTAAGYQLATGLAVMAIGGFNGSDPSPTLAEFQQQVADGKIHYYLGGAGDASGGSGSDRGRMQNGGSRIAEDIATWVSENFTKITVDGVELYDLSQAR